MESEREYFVNSMGQRVYYAHYLKPLLEEYVDNPLIEALPPILSAAEAEDKMMRYPKWDDSERQYPNEIRRQSVLKLTEYFQPWDIHTELEQRISALIRRGYISRNPLSPEYALDSHSIYKSILSKTTGADLPQLKPSTATTLSILGASGVGKTTAIENVLSLYPQVICHQSYDGPPFNQYQITWLKIECPFDGSLKNLCRRFFENMDRLLDENYSSKYGSARTTTDAMIPHMEAIAHRHHLGVLVIDEIQILTEAKNLNINHMLNFFTSLVNTIKIPIVLIGTEDALDLLQKDFRHARRGIGHSGPVIFEPLSRGDVWDLLIEGLWSYQWTRDECPLTEELCAVMHEESQGIVDIAVKLYSNAQILAIEDGTERITVELIQRASKESLRLVRKDLDALKKMRSKGIGSSRPVVKTPTVNGPSLRPKTTGIQLPTIDPVSIEPSDPDDLRLIARQAKDSKVSVHDKLKELGIIPNVLDLTANRR